MSRRYGSQNAINNLGGDWRNLFIYVRTWAFLSQDWRIAMRIERDSGYILTSEKVCLTLPGVRLPVQFDTWVWKVPVGHVTETKIGCTGLQWEQDQLRFSLLRRCTTSANNPGPTRPPSLPWIVKPVKRNISIKLLSDKDLEQMVQSLSNLAKNGPHPPLNALRQPSICKKCGYQQLCFEKNFISQHAFKDL